LTEIILVRHGQANAQATTEEGYDQLSDLGRQQSRWLGEYLSDNSDEFDRVLSGTLNRQIDTGVEMGHKPTQDKRLNELRYYATAQILETEHDIPMPQSEADYTTHLPILMRYWQRGKIKDAPESYQEFQMRILHVISELCSKGGRSLVITSSGVIGMVLTQILELNVASQSKLMLSIQNTSYHSIKLVDGSLFLTGFNATPHLDGAERANSRSFV